MKPVGLGIRACMKPDSPEIRDVSSWHGPTFRGSAAFCLLLGAKRKFPAQLSFVDRCAGFRMTARYRRCQARWGRRPKAFKEGTRGR
jgi:hypothetical protein